MSWLREWRRRQRLARHRIDDEVWREATAGQCALQGLTEAHARRLRDLATLLIAEKQFIGVAGHEVTPLQAVRIAALGALPILALDLDWYGGWHSIVVYASGFRARHEVRDDAGVVHACDEALSGEAWEQGPLVLSWEDVAAGAAADGYNVVIHEFAHKLDMRNGDANGMPPLHRDMAREAWTRTFESAYAATVEALRQGVDPGLDAYAAESPAEFFAVASEAFFELPALLHQRFPDVYRQLTQFYRQDPLHRGRREQMEDERHGIGRHRIG